MEAVRKNPWAKLAAALLMLALAFSGSWFGYRAMTALPFAGAENWQQTEVCYSLLQDRESQLAGGVAAAIQLQRGTDGMSYLAVQSAQESLEALEERMDAQNTWFRFQVKTADGGQVLATNLKEGRASLKRCTPCGTPPLWWEMGSPRRNTTSITVKMIMFFPSG